MTAATAPRGGRVFIDSFSGSAAEMTRVDQAVPIKVLRVLVRDGKVSVWDRDASPSLHRSICDLQKRGLIDKGDAPYPWYRFHVLPAGLEMLDALSTATPLP